MRTLFDKDDIYISNAEYDDYCTDNEIEPTEEGYYDYCSDVEEEDYNNALAECSRLFPGKVKMHGNVERWDGDTAISTMILPDIDTALDEAGESGEEIAKLVLKDDGTLWVVVRHHDGTNYFTIANAE